MYIAIGTMLGVFANGLPYIDWVRLIVSLIGVIMFFRHYRLFRRNNVFRLLYFMMIIILLPTVVRYVILQPVRAESIRFLGDSVLWISVLVLAYFVAYKTQYTLYNSRLIALTIPIYYFIFQSVQGFLQFNTDDTALISTAYYALFLLPFALMIKRKWLNYILIGFILLTIVLSSKRAGFISFLGAILIYVYFTMKVKSNFKTRLKYLLSFAFLCFIGLQLFFNFISTNDVHILERLANIGEDGGSGRDEVYAYTFGLLLESNIPALIFGHGFNSVVQFSELELSAHTDWLETPYDYGIIGLIVYIVFYFRLFKYYHILKWYHIVYAPIFLSTIFITVILSTFAHLIIYPTHFLFFCMYWGFVMGECDRIIDNKMYS